MDNSLRALCDAIKKIIIQLKPQTNQLSFLIISGKTNQGKSSILKQAKMEEIPVFSEQHAKIYFNQKGLIVELGESWFTNSKTLLQNTIRQLNKCSHYLKITGIIFCIDMYDLVLSEPAQFTEKKKSHLQFLDRLGANLGYQVNLSLLFTKMDTLAGFSEFYQTDHPSELAKPLGFSLDCINNISKKTDTFAQQFKHLIEVLGQQVINRMHPVRSTIKRSLIREFPLQLASLRGPLQSVIQGISSTWFNLNSIYFTSAEQGGISIDRLNKKIQHEYALVVQDTFPQSTNFKSYFVEGAIGYIQDQCSQLPQKRNYSQKPFIVLTSSIAALFLVYLSYSYYKTSHLLDEASKELLTYDTLSKLQNNSPQALYHLARAAHDMDSISSNAISLPTVHQLKLNLHNNTLQHLEGEFLPSLAQELEEILTSPNSTPITRYKALKIYLMMGQSKHFVSQEVFDWFQTKWDKQFAHSNEYKKQLALLKQILNKPLNNFPIKKQVISDARNYLNALPSSYLYYSLAKESFPSGKQKIAVEGFTLATQELPVYYTKEGFKSIIQSIPKISRTLQSENWVLARQDLSLLNDMLIQAYCFDYATWWQAFIRKSQPLHYVDYQQGRKVIKLLQESNAINKLVALIQQETKPDITDEASSFNQFIASRFTELNLMSQASTKDFSFKVADLERFISTLSVVNDKGKTAFSIARSRFINENGSDAVSMLFTQARLLPEPLSSWANQIAGDTWAILIKESRSYINQEWERTVYREYISSIAKRYPFDSAEQEEINIHDFNHFFATHGVLNTFSEQYLKPFLDVSSAQWKPKELNEAVLPITSEALDEIIRANIITNMFYPDKGDSSKIDFSLQKISLDPVISRLILEIGHKKLVDNQTSDSFIRFSWPENNVKLALDSIEGNHYELSEDGTWALFKLLEKVNVLIDEQDSSSLQILFEVNSNSGRYLLKTNNQVNPFTPGILNGFKLSESIV